MKTKQTLKAVYTIKQRLVIPFLIDAKDQFQLIELDSWRLQYVKRLDIFIDHRWCEPEEHACFCEGFNFINLYENSKTINHFNCCGIKKNNCKVIEDIDDWLLANKFGQISWIFYKNIWFDTSKAALYYLKENNLPSKLYNIQKMEKINEKI